MRSLLFTSIAATLLLLTPASGAASHEWRVFPDTDKQVALWENGQQVGVLLTEEAKFYKLISPGHFEKALCPVGIPAGFLKVCKRTPEGDCCSGKHKAKADSCPCCGDNCLCGAGKHCGKSDCRCVLNQDQDTELGRKERIDNYGVDFKHISGGKHFLNGREVGKKEMLKAIEKPNLPDDASLLALTVIGPDATRAAVVKDLDSNPALAPYKKLFRVKDYAPDHWAVKDVGFFTGGNPTVYIQDPTGKVLHRQDTYAGPDALAKILEKVTGALRDKNDGYDSSKDPDLGKQALDFFQKVPLQVWIVGGVVLLFIVLRKQPA